MSRYLIVLGVLFWVGVATANDEDLTIESPHGHTVKFDTGADNPYLLRVTSEKPCTGGYGLVKVHLDPSLGLAHEWVEIQCGMVIEGGGDDG